MQGSMAGWGNGLLGVIIFSASLPATRIAVGGFSPLFLTSARAVIAAVLGIGLLVLLKQSRPSRSDFVSLVIVAIGVVVGFPLQGKEEKRRKGTRQKHRDRERRKHQNNRFYNILFYRVFLQWKEVRVFFNTILAQLPAEAQTK